MKYDPNQLARLLAEETVGKSDADAAAAVKRFLSGLAERGVASLAPLVLEKLSTALDREAKVEEVTVHAARELPAAELAAVLKAHGFDPKKSNVTQMVEPEHIGGYRVVGRDRVVDGSVAGTLSRLSAQLAGK